MQKRILNFFYLPSLHTGIAIANCLLKKIFTWNLDDKVMCFALDNCATNDVVIKELKERLPTTSMLLDEKLLHVRCTAHILNLIVQEGVQIANIVITKIRDSMRFVKSSTFRQQKFMDMVDQVKGPKKKLIMDVPTRWNLTYEMLETAMQFRRVFARLIVINSTYKCEPNIEEWITAEVVASCFSLFYSITKTFPWSLHPYANHYFPLICNIHLKFNDFCKSEDPLVVQIDTCMKKFDKY